MKHFAGLLIAIALFSSAFHAQHHHSDIGSTGEEKSEKTNLVDEFGILGHCDIGSRFDNFFSELSQRPDSVGYVLVYQSVDVLPVNYDSPPMERMFRNHMSFRNFDLSRVIVINAGFRSDQRTQLWIVPPGCEIPVPQDTVPAPVISESETIRFDRSDLISDELGSLTLEFELPSVRAEREAAEAEMLSDSEEESLSAESDEAISPADTAATEELETEEGFVDDRTPEEIEAERFSWISDKFGKLLETRKDTTGVMIFYADDETLDIARLQEFIEQGRQRLAAAAGISPDRLKVRFGGYHDYPIVDYWIVPPRGVDPVATPAERPVPELEEGELATPGS
jgi:hypothetical protein